MSGFAGERDTGRCPVCDGDLAVGWTHDYCAACARWLCRHAGACPVGLDEMRERPERWQP